MANTFTIGSKYNASQNTSQLSLGNGNTPLFYQGLTYQGFDADTNEHCFDYEGELKWFDDEFINNGRSEDNSMIFAEIPTKSNLQNTLISLSNRF